MLQLPMTPIRTFKIALYVYDDKGVNCIEMLPRPLVDLQGVPNLLVYQAIASNGDILASRAYIDETWVEYDPAIHTPEAGIKSKAKAQATAKAKTQAKANKAQAKAKAKQKSELESAPKLPLPIRKLPLPTKTRKPIPKAGVDAVHIQTAKNEAGGSVVNAKVSSHIEPKQSTGAPAPAPQVPLSMLGSQESTLSPKK